MAALQQVVRNAVMHRTYEATNAPVHVYWFNDRIEVLSPGGPFVAVTEANFGQPGVVDYRNPRLSEAMKVLGFVQRFGIGIQTAQETLRKNGNPLALFEIQPTTIKCTIYQAPNTQNQAEGMNAPANAPGFLKMSMLQNQIISCIEENLNISYDDLSKRLNRDRTTIMRNIRKLKQQKILERIGSTKAGQWNINRNMLSK